MARFNGMPGNANNMMKQLQKMQKQMEEQAKAFESKEFEATAGGGAVRVTVVGGRGGQQDYPGQGRRGSGRCRDA